MSSSYDHRSGQPVPLPPHANLAIGTHDRLEVAVHTTSVSLPMDKNASFVTMEGQPLELSLREDAESNV